MTTILLSTQGLIEIGHSINVEWLESKKSNEQLLSYISNKFGIIPVKTDLFHNKLCKVEIDGKTRYMYHFKIVDQEKAMLLVIKYSDYIIANHD